MNKKSLFLTLLLIGGLFTPQETKSNSLITGSSFFLGTVLYGIVCTPIGIISTLSATSKIYSPKCASDFLKDETKIASYSTHIIIKDKRKIILETTLKVHSYKILAEKIEHILATIDITKTTKVIITPILTLTNNKIYHLKKITNKKLIKYPLSESLSKAFEVADHVTNPTYEIGKSIIYFIPLMIIIYALYS